MRFLDECKYDENFIYFPILDSNEFVKFSWNEDENFEEALKRNNSRFRYHYHSWKIADYLEHFYGNDLSHDHIFVYEVICEFNKKEYYLISIWEMDGENWNSCFCLPRNAFNLFIFYKEFIKPLRD